MHILKGRADGSVAYTGIAGFQLLHGQIWADSPGRSHFQSVIIDGARRNMGAMAYGIGNHSPDAVDGQFAEILRCSHSCIQIPAVAPPAGEMI